MHTRYRIDLVLSCLVLYIPTQSLQGRMERPCLSVLVLDDASSYVCGKDDCICGLDLEWEFDVEESW